MEYDEMLAGQREIHELSGALTALGMLQEKLELRLNEAPTGDRDKLLDHKVCLE